MEIAERALKENRRAYGSVDSSTVPPGFVIYRESELEHICDLSAEGLRRVHRAKRAGAIIKGDRPEQVGT